MSSITDKETYLEALLTIKFRLKRLAEFQIENRKAHKELKKITPFDYQRELRISDNRQEMLYRRPEITALHNYYCAIREKEPGHGHSRQDERSYAWAFNNLVKEFGSVETVLGICDSKLSQGAA